MNSRTIISGLDSDRLGQALFEELERIHPSGGSLNSRGNSKRFDLRLPSDDPRTIRVIERLARAGFTPWTNPFLNPLPNQYSMKLEHVYEPSDLADVEYFVPMARIYSEGLTRTTTGLIELDAGKLVPDADVAFSDLFKTIVSGRIKEILTSAAPRHLYFKPTVLTRGGYEDSSIPRQSIGSPFWEVTSDLTLPPLASTCTLLNNEGVECRGDFSSGCFLREGLFANPEPHYTRESIEASSPFDAALSQERFGIAPKDEDRLLIVSRRFREQLLGAWVEIDWTPVRVDLS
jgi:hypothetical protein